MIRAVRGSKRVFSNSAMLIPQTMPPTSWLFAVLALRIRPQSKAPTKRTTRTSPRSGSTSTSAKCAPKACCRKRSSSSSSGSSEFELNRRPAGIEPPAAARDCSRIASAALTTADPTLPEAFANLPRAAPPASSCRRTRSARARRERRESPRPAARRPLANRSLARSSRTHQERTVRVQIDSHLCADACVARDAWPSRVRPAFSRGASSATRRVRRVHSKRSPRADNTREMLAAVRLTANRGRQSE